MASLALQLKSHYNKPSQTLLKTTSSNFTFTHFFSSSSSSSENNSNNNNKNDDEKPSEKPYAFSGYFNDIKSKLKNQQEHHHHQQQQQPNHSPGVRPSNLSPPNSPNSSTSFDEIKKNLSEFRRRSSEFPLQQSQQHNVLQRGGNAGNFGHGRPANLSFDSIRDSLEQMKGRRVGKGNNSNNNNNNMNDSMSLNMYQKSLKLKPAVGGGGGKVIGGSMENLPMSVFKRELKEKEMAEKGEAKGGGDDSLSVEFSRLYTYEQLGEKLRELRPEVKGEKSGEEGSFSLSELNERVKKLKEIEKVEQMKDPVMGPAFREIKTSLRTLKDDKSKNKIIPMHGISILSPSSIKASPKEHLVEKYFHPDNMSSEEKLKLKLEAVRDEFKMHESDCGSTRVQIAQLTTEILHLSSVLHKKDKHSRRGLQAKVQQRKKLLKYLRRTDWESYSFILSKLGLRDNPDYKN